MDRAEPSNHANHHETKTLVDVPPLPGAGDVVGGRYRLESEIGRGGQSVVFKGLDLKAGDEVALKILHHDAKKDPNAVERMFREAYAMACLTGTSALGVLDQAWTDQGYFCLVTELIVGEDLGDWLERHFEGRQRHPSAHDLYAVFAPLVYTLQAAHDKGIIHRDLKPQNIFIVDPSQGGGIKLIDFGFAKFTRMRGFTARNTVAGSPSFLAPEAWSGKVELFDQRLDVYALGALLFRCLTGQVPFRGEGVAALYRLATTQARPRPTQLRPELPAALDHWTEAALAIDPEERFNSVEALWTAFSCAAGLEATAH